MVKIGTTSTLRSDGTFYVVRYFLFDNDRVIPQRVIEDRCPIRR